MPAPIDSEKEEESDVSSSIVVISSPTSVVLDGITDEEDAIEPMCLTSSISSSDWSKLSPSAKSTRTKNPIREIVDPIVANMQRECNNKCQKKPISLALGDPTVFENFDACPVLATAISSTSGAGYVNALGTDEARQAIATYHSIHDLGVKYEPDDVIVASGCSGTLELVLTALLDPDTVLLVPQPGFPLYEVIAKSHGATVEYYRLQSDHDWHIDLNHVYELVHRLGKSVRGIVINNPANPTGAVYSKQHLQDIVQVCDDCKIPIVADEVYGGIVFGSHQFHPVASIVASMGDRVPVVTCSGLAKQFLLPGWRVGWALFRDNKFRSLSPVHDGAKRLAQIILGASHLAQTAIPVLLDRDNRIVADWKESIRCKFETQASCIASRLRQIPGLEVLPSGGAMYMMIRIQRDRFEDTLCDQQFTSLLLREENVFVLPGTCFGFPNAFRLVFSAPVHLLLEAANRIEEFCKRHYSHH